MKFNSFFLFILISTPLFSMEVDSIKARGKRNIHAHIPMLDQTTSSEVAPERTKRRCTIEGASFSSDLPNWLLDKNLTSKEKLKKLLRLSEANKGLTAAETDKGLQLVSYMYRGFRQSSKTLKENQQFLSIGKHLLHAILKRPLEVRYFGKHVNLLKYLGKIGDVAYQDPTDRLACFEDLLATYNSFHTHAIDLFRKFDLPPQDQILYNAVYLKIFQSSLELTEDVADQKKLLLNIIERNERILSLRKNIGDSEDINSLFNSYDRLYTLEADTTARFKIIVCAVDWCKKLSANYSVAPLVRHLIEQYASKYKSLKTTLLQTRINGPQARMDRLLPPLLPPIEPPLLTLSSFKHELDAEMLGKFTLNF